MRRIAILDAPSNLGLRPPTATSVPGCAKAPGALRDQGLIPRLQARDAGCLTPPRYDPGDWRPGDGVCQATEIAAYSRRLADRITAIIDAGEFPVVLGGDCSIVLGSGLAMNRLGDEIGGRIGLIFVDGHSDFRHPGNASYVGAAAGEDLALVTGRGQPDLAAMEGRRPYFRDIDVVVMGIRAQDEYRLDLQAAGIVTRPVPTLRVEGAARSAQWARDQLVDCAGYWVHVDMDVLDPAVMPAVDAPDPGGIAFPELEILLAGLVDTPHCLGVEITVFDPDYDPDGSYAAEITSALVAGLAPVRTVEARPDLVAARADLARPEPTVPVGSSAEETPRNWRAAGAPEETLRRRRAAGAQSSVTAAAAAMSEGGSAPGGSAAVPATTVLRVGDAPAGAGAASDPVLAAVGAEHGLNVAAGDAGPVDAEHDLNVAAGDAGPVDAEHDLNVAAGDAGPVDAEHDLNGAAGDAGPAGGAAEQDFRPASAAADEGAGAAEMAAGEEPAVVGVVAGDVAGGPDERPVIDGHDVPAARVESPDPGGVTTGSEAEDDGQRAGHGGLAASPGPGFGAGERSAYDSFPNSGPGQDGPLVGRLGHDDVGGGSRRGGEHPRPGHGGGEHGEARQDDAGSGDAGSGDAGSDDADVGGVGRDEVEQEGIERGETVRKRPLGQAPLLDSEPLPATMPGMLRPRTSDGFSLPTQRPVFDVGPGEPADVS